MKAFTLIVLVLGLSCALAQSLRASPQRTCQLSMYGPIPPPVCQTVTDANGQQQQECYALGSAAMAAILDKNTKSISESTGLSEFGFSGYCKCTIKLWAGANFTGKAKTYKFNESKTDVMVSDIWSQESNSFKVTCQF
jgi:hypothetical protein